MSTTQHPLTETDAAEITDEMVEAGASYAWEEGHPGFLGWNSLTEYHKEGCRRDVRNALSAALAIADPHHDPRPWEPLNGPVRVGDEVRQEWYGVTRSGIVAGVDGNGDPWTAEGGYIGPILGGTWYARRAAQPTLPTTDGAVIIPADGREYIEAEVNGQTFITREAVVCQSEFGPANVLEGAWRRSDNRARAGGQLSRDFITPGTWKVERE